MRGPTGVGNRDLAEEGLGLVDIGFRKVLVQSHDFIQPSSHHQPSPVYSLWP